MTGCAVPAMSAIDTSTSIYSPVRSTADATTCAASGFVHSIIIVKATTDYPMSAVGASRAPASTYPCGGTVATAGGVCPTGIVAALVPPLPNLGVMPADGCHTPRRTTLFFGASARGVLSLSALQKARQ